MSGADSDMIRVIVVDDEYFACRAMKMLLDSSSMQVIQMHQTITDGARAILEHSPEVAVVDLRWPNDQFAGLKLLKELHEANSKTACLLFTHIADVRGFIIQEAFSYGVRGIYRKSRMDGTELTGVIMALARGETVIEPVLVSNMLNDIGAPAVTPPEIKDTLPKFTPREREVLALLNSGLAPKEVAQALGIAQNTVKGYLQDARDKFDGRMNSYQLAVYAAIHGWLQDDPPKGGD
jgi:DNA-binding NarL/FixJ family response regulator